MAKWNQIISYFVEILTTKMLANAVISAYNKSIEFNLKLNMQMIK